MLKVQAQYFICVICNYHSEIDEDTVTFYVKRKKFEGVEFPEPFQ